MPAGGKKGASTVVAISLPKEIEAYLKAEMATLGVRTPKERQEFMRGAIFGAVIACHRSKVPAWKRFYKQVQPLARKTIGAGLEMADAEATMLAGKLD